MKHQQTHGRVWRLLLLVCVLAFSMPAVLVRSQSAADPDGTRQTATPVPLRSDTPGWLGRDDVDYFRVTLSQRGLLHVETTGSTDTKGALLNASGRWLAIDDDSSPNGYNFRIRRTLSAGTYYIRVYGAFTSTTGSYTLQVRFRASGPTGGSDDHGGTRQTATPVTLRSDTSGRLGRGDVDYFRVTLSQRGLLHVETTGSTNTKGGCSTPAGVGYSPTTTAVRTAPTSVSVAPYPPAPITSGYTGPSPPPPAPTPYRSASAPVGRPGVAMTMAAPARRPPRSRSGATPPGGLAGAMWTISVSPSPNGASSMSRPPGLPIPRGGCSTPAGVGYSPTTTAVRTATTSVSVAPYPPAPITSGYTGPSPPPPVPTPYRSASAPGRNLHLLHRPHLLHRLTTITQMM